MKSIFLHADDYALTKNTSKDIIDCIQQGSLDGISILDNMSSYEDCIELLEDSIPSFPFLPKLFIHINLVEGRSLSAADSDISKDGLLDTNWEKLFFLSYSPWRAKIKELLKKEICAQIEREIPDLNECIAVANEKHIPCKQNGICIDFHQHAHVIPVVWDALQEVIQEKEMPIEYIRSPKEPLSPFYKYHSPVFSYPPINFVKNRIVDLYSHDVDLYLERNKLPAMYMWGLMMSGKMDFKRIKQIFPAMKEYSRDNNRALVLLFHPGQMLKDEYNLEISLSAMRNFYLSENRHIEKEAVMLTKKELL